ncbi:unnamed protein product, partial [Symbiodinium necroappetens]
VVINNLGGKGPSRQMKAEEIRYVNVCSYHGHSVDLVIQTPGNYTPGDSSLNALAGAAWQVDPLG